MQTPIVLRLDPNAKRYAWPWSNLEFGDVVHVYAPAHLHSRVYAASSYFFPRKPSLKIITKRLTDASGEEYIRCEVTDKRVLEIERVREVARLAAIQAEEDARVEAAMAVIRAV
jgi:hypothetical protein